MPATASAADGPSAAPSAPILPVVLSGGAVLPTRAHDTDAGHDLCAATDLEIPPLGRALVPTGVSLAVPAGTVGMVCPRSGLAVRHGITVLNGPGIVDAGYRGEIRVPLHNTDPEQAFAIRAGDRIAQLVIVPFLAPVLQQVDELDDTARAGAGFGSSGGFGPGPVIEEEV
ncbi:dUTP diphosphatase [Brachybacterium nesterenkovii]|nr:dUTP diphosphatase [Brachybacterium nesterenkovii]